MIHKYLYLSNAIGLSSFELLKHNIWHKLLNVSSKTEQHEAIHPINTAIFGDITLLITLCRFACQQGYGSFETEESGRSLKIRSDRTKPCFRVACTCYCFGPLLRVCLCHLMSGCLTKIHNHQSHSVLTFCQCNCIVIDT